VDAVKPSIAFFDVGAAANGRDLRATRQARLTGAARAFVFNRAALGSSSPADDTTRRGEVDIPGGMGARLLFVHVHHSQAAGISR
jgi:hypothetical protein